MISSNHYDTLPQTIVELPALINNLLLLLSDKEKDVIKKRFSLEFNKKYTLDQIGKEFSVTRERIRQIERNALSKMRRNVFNTALNALHTFASDVVKNHDGLIKRDLFYNEISSLMPSVSVNKDCLNLAVVLHDNLVSIGNTINFHPYIRVENLSDYSLKFASNHLVNQLHKYGNVKVLDKLHSDLKPVFEDLNFDLDKIKSLIRIDKRMILLEDDLVGLLEWRHIHPRTLRDKILYILRKEKTSLHFSDIAEKIMSEKFDPRSINVQAVHNELIRHDSFVLIGRGIYALAEWGYEKGTVSSVIEKILETKKELPQDKIVELVLKQRKVKEITILLSLKNNEKFERVGRKRYRLRS